MIFFRSVGLTFVILAAVVVAAPLEAQPSATLHVSARVVQECTVSVSSKRALVKLARKLNDPSIISRCSKGVVSRVDKQVITIPDQAPAVTQPPLVSGKPVLFETIAGKTDVVLVTVSY